MKCWVLLKCIMHKFYLFLWLRWAAYVTLYSLLIASVLSALMTFILYISRGLPPLDVEMYGALFLIWKFLFPLFWSFSLLVALFRSLKILFNVSISGYEMKLLSCKDSKPLLEIGYGNLLPVWRKWFLLLIWLASAQMIVALVFTYFLSDFGGVFEWFSIYWLFGFVLLGGYFSFMVLSSRCKRVKIEQC